MGVQVTIGGDRLRSGSKMRTNLSGYGWSSHNLSTTWRSTQNYGTIVPCFKQIVLKGDTWHIDTSVMVRTLPTSGALYGSFKAQVDFFFCPFRLTIGALHNNATGIALKMSEVKFPTIKLPALYNPMKSINECQIAPDTLMAYLGIRGVGNPVGLTPEQVASKGVGRRFNAASILQYYDICKNYMINKQEDYFGMITTVDANMEIEKVGVSTGSQINYIGMGNKKLPIGSGVTSTIILDLTTPISRKLFSPEQIINGIEVEIGNQLSTTPVATKTLRELGATSVEYINNDFLARSSTIKIKVDNSLIEKAATMKPAFIEGVNIIDSDPMKLKNTKEDIGIGYFDIKQLDEMREAVLEKVKIGQHIQIGEDDTLPEFLKLLTRVSDDGFEYDGWGGPTPATAYSQNGLVLKSYLSDIFNNWIKSEWIDEINKKTKVDTTDGFTMDALAMARKAWTYLNRTVVSGGTYQDWEEAVTGTQAQHFCEMPMFIGGMSFDVVFDEVVSTAASGDEPLGTIGGRGNITNVKGGRVSLKAKEYGYIMALVSYTPRVDYFQGNDFDMYALEAMEDLYKPEFGNIGFQDLIQEQQAAWTTDIAEDGTVTQKTHGKQPAWINYQTNYNRVYGDFARSGNLDYMVITRDYKPSGERLGQSSVNIADETTIIDPADYAYLFARRDLEVQPLWTQIRFDVHVRRIMSASIIPNL